MSTPQDIRCLYREPNFFSFVCLFFLDALLDKISKFPFTYYISWKYYTCLSSHTLQLVGLPQKIGKRIRDVPCRPYYLLPHIHDFGKHLGPKKKTENREVLEIGSYNVVSIKCDINFKTLCRVVNTEEEHGRENRLHGPTQRYRRYTLQTNMFLRYTKSIISESLTAISVTVVSPPVERRRQHHLSQNRWIFIAEGPLSLSR